VTHRTGTSLVEALLLAFWLGAAALFTLVVARAAFAVLPTRALAGALVGRVLPVVFIGGIVTGALLLVLEWRAPVTRRGVAVAAGVMTACCIAAQFVVAPRIERLRSAIGGPLDALDPGDPRRLAFGRLHAVSVGWLGVAMLAAALALALIWRSFDPAPSSSTRPATSSTDG